MKQVCIGIYVESEPQRVNDTLTSVLAHTSSEAEVVVLLDGVAESSLLFHHPKVKVLRSPHQEARGAAAGFNRLAKYSNADVIVFLESGARVAPRWLEHLLRALEGDSQNGLAGPSTNNSWNEQGVFPRAGGSEPDVARTGLEAEEKFGNQVQTLEPLHSLADFCYAVKREVIEAIGATDENYSLGPCWEMDYNIRASRAGWRGVWVGAAYVHRAPLTRRRRNEEARRFEASKRLYQNKFCGARLRGEKTDFRPHCRGDACENFAPANLIEIKRPFPSVPEESSAVPSLPAIVYPTAVSADAPLVTCIMPTYNRRAFVPQAIRCFLRQDYPNAELLVVDDGTDSIEDCVPQSERIRYLRLGRKMTIGAKRNLACEQARGEFIVHWDDDDWYPANRVTRQVAAMSDRHSDISGSSRIYYYDSSLEQAWEYRYPKANQAWVGGNTLAYRKTFWQQHRFPDVQVGEDSRFVWSSRGKSICDLADASLCVATAHSGNTSRKDFGGSYWSAHSRDRLTSLLGDDIYFYSFDRRDWPLVSCIMPTYNRRAYLAQSLQCFRQQDYPNRELIVVDDGTDPVEDLVRAEENIRYLRSPRRMSIGAKRNLACQHARGEIIAHWDDDDWYAADRLRYQVTPIVCAGVDLTGLENALVLQLPAGDFWTTDARLHQRMFVGNVHGGTLVYRKEIWTQGLRYPEVNLAEDAWLLHRATRQGKRLLRLANPGVFVYVRHNTNAWREFAPGTFIDPDGWQRIPRPLDFPNDVLSFFVRTTEGQGRS